MNKKITLSVTLSTQTKLLREILRVEQLKLDVSFIDKLSS